MSTSAKRIRKVKEGLAFRLEEQCFSLFSYIANYSRLCRRDKKGKGCTYAFRWYLFICYRFLASLCDFPSYDSCPRLSFNTAPATVPGAPLLLDYLNSFLHLFSFVQPFIYKHLRSFSFFLYAFNYQQHSEHHHKRPPRLDHRHRTHPLPREEHVKTKHNHIPLPPPFISEIVESARAV